ncbi:MAG: VWA domain-containing protein [Phycisphaerae bacterium]|nr:VWA domain-containing protein [Phycisphaerae bacterium]
MNHFRHGFMFRLLDNDDVAPPPRDELDSLLRDWHRQHADLAASSRESVLQTIADDQRPARDTERAPVLARIGRAMTGRLARVAACVALVGIITTAIFMPAREEARASELVVADGGALTAHDESGDLLGPCPLQHTDVQAEITGPFTRVSLKQRYANPYPQKIEATYTFPMSHRSAVDSMRIRVKGPSGERVIEGEVKERNVARQIYDTAKASGYVASLLEQERPNIFTQKVANIEPGATVEVEISYLETLERKDGVYSFEFPMTVGPRYIPGTPTTGGDTKLPDGLVARAGLVLQGPAMVEVTTPDAAMSSSAVQQLVVAAQPIRRPTPDWFERNSTANGPAIEFVATYANGSKEKGVIYSGGIGHVKERYFWFGTPGAGGGGGGFASDTTQVPDASRITPMPAKPPERSGHDVSMRVVIDSGDAPLTAVNSELHEITTTNDGGRTVIELKEKNAIPNRDFILSWKTDANLIAPGVFAHMRNTNDLTKGGYVAVVLDPPARLNETEIPPRELIFVLDTSGSMNGFPIEKAKEVMTKAIAGMRPRDTFNVITFAGSTRVLWPDSRVANDENRLAAQQFVNGSQSGGGTEMMAAINAALKPLDRGVRLSPLQLADLPADGRRVVVLAPVSALNTAASTLALENGKSLNVTMGTSIPTIVKPDGQMLVLEGAWKTDGGDRRFAIDRASFERSTISPMRVVMFLTDGFVGNDGGIIQAVRDNARTTRVFSFGIGQSVNRNLLEGMALEGRGACDVVTLAENADAAVARFLKRIQNPVLVDISATFDGVEVVDLVPKPEAIPDLFDESPLVLLGRYEKPGSGTVTIRGTNGAGAWEKSMPVSLPAQGSAHAAVPTLWARAKVDEILAPKRALAEAGQLDQPTRNAIVGLGEAFRIMTPYTSFVAVERGRVTVGGTPILVHVPIELPEGTSWSGFFGEGVAPAAWLAMQPVGGDKTSRASNVETRLDALGSLYDRAPNAEVFATGTSEKSSTQTAYFRQLAARVNPEVRKEMATELTDDAQLAMSQFRFQEAELLARRALVLNESSVEAKEVKDKISELQSIAGNLEKAAELRRLLDAGVRKAERKLSDGDVESARSAALTARARIDRERSSLTPVELAERTAQLDALLAKTAGAESGNGDHLQAEARYLQPDSLRAAMVEEDLKRIRTLQSEMKYDEALQVVDEVLFLDGSNPAGLALRDTLKPLVAYRAGAGEGRVKQVGVGWTSVDIQEAIQLPRPNLSGDASPANGHLVAYPEGLPALYFQNLTPLVDGPVLIDSIGGSLLQLSRPTDDLTGIDFDWAPSYYIATDGSDGSTKSKSSLATVVPETNGGFGGGGGGETGMPAKRTAGTPIKPSRPTSEWNVPATAAPPGSRGLAESESTRVAPAPSVTRTIEPAPKDAAGEAHSDKAKADAQPAQPAPAPAPSAGATPGAPTPPPAPAPTAPARPAPKAEELADAPKPQGRVEGGGLYKSRAPADPGAVKAAPSEPAPAATVNGPGGAGRRDEVPVRPGGAAHADLAVAAPLRAPLTDAERNLLARRLERTLLMLALAAQADPAAALDVARTIVPVLPLDGDGFVRVTILAGKDPGAAKALADALRAEKVTVDGTDERHGIVVAKVKLERLIDLALRNDVRRIEATKESR